MEYISPSQLQSFLDPRAFAVSRTAARGALDVTESVIAIESEKTNTTLNVLLGAEQRLADFRTSLQTMLDLTIQGAKSGSSDRLYDEAYGKLRSLTAGFDQVLEATTFGGKVMFDGREWKLDANGQPVELEGMDLRAAGDNLGLVERSEGAKVTVGYDAATIIRNSNSGVVGLDIADAVGIPRTDGQPELESGKYHVEIEYNGPQSRLIFSDEFGMKIEELTDIDLTGSGIDLIKFKAGIQISLEKLKTTIGYDKWDYENDGPVSLHADLNYERVAWHTLAGDTNRADAVAEAEWTYKGTKDYSSPSLNLGDINPNGVISGAQELAEGSYSLKVKYRGEKSIVEVRDLNGMMMLRMNDVDLGPESGTYTIDTGKGVKFTIENTNFGYQEKEINATFNYKPTPANNRDFDFLAYGERLVDAIAVVDEQLSSVTSSIEQIQERSALARGQTSGSSSITSLLGGGGSVASLLSGANVSARLNVSGMQLFSSINGGVSTQGTGATNILSFMA